MKNWQIFAIIGGGLAAAWYVSKNGQPGSKAPAANSPATAAQNQNLASAFLAAPGATSQNLANQIQSLTAAGGTAVGGLNSLFGTVFGGGTGASIAPAATDQNFYDTTSADFTPDYSVSDG